MPGSNGFQSTEALRKEYPSARVIIVTAHNEPHFQQLSQVAGADALVRKENLYVVRMILTNEMTSSNPLPSTSESPSPTAS
jgi:DNA-binding NarL/FixJ family response regulator